MPPFPLPLSPGQAPTPLKKPADLPALLSIEVGEQKLARRVFWAVGTGREGERGRARDEEREILESILRETQFSEGERGKERAKGRGKVRRRCVKLVRHRNT